MSAAIVDVIQGPTINTEITASDVIGCVRFKDKLDSRVVNTGTVGHSLKHTFAISQFPGEGTCYPTWYRQQQKHDEKGTFSELGSAMRCHRLGQEKSIFFKKQAAFFRS